MIKFHIGCGPCYLDGYTNIDNAPQYKTDICADVLTLDFKGVDAIFSCHFFEHLSYPADAVKCLNLFYNWLNNGGVLRLVVPDLRLAATAYVMNEDLRFLYGNDFKGYYYKDTPAERLNFFVKAWQHQMCYDFELLSQLLSDAGFKYIQRKQPNESLIPDFSHDRYISESLYIEAQK
jgi:predicted SAM-dependent methyltransferase